MIDRYMRKGVPPVIKRTVTRLKMIKVVSRTLRSPSRSDIIPPKGFATIPARLKREKTAPAATRVR
jgi:hypothetical protein